MNTSVYLPDPLAQRLEKYVANQQAEISKNRVIALAIEQFLDREDAEDRWSKAVMDWQGAAGFELNREEGLLGFEEEVF